MIRIVVFKGRGDALLVHAGTQPRAVALPPLCAPFTRLGVAESCRSAGFEATVIESLPQRWTQGLVDARKAEQGARGARQGAEEALRAAVLKGSVDPHQRDRSVLVERFQAINTERQALKAKLAQLGPVCISREERLERDQMIARVAELNVEGTAVQAQITSVKKQHQAEHDTKGATFERRFISAAKAMLDADTFSALCAEADPDAEDEP